MNSLELTSAITAIANAIAKKLSPGKINLFESVLMQLGDTLTTIAANNELREEKTDKQIRRRVLYSSANLFFMILRDVYIFYVY